MSTRFFRHDLTKAAIKSCNATRSVCECDNRDEERDAQSFAHLIYACYIFRGPRPRSNNAEVRVSERAPSGYREARQSGNYTLRRYCVTCMPITRIHDACACMTSRRVVTQVAINLPRGMNLSVGDSLSV